MALNSNKNIHVIGVQVDRGTGSMGADLGPKAIRCAELKQMLEQLGYSVTELPDIIQKTSTELNIPPATSRSLKNLEIVNHVNTQLYKCVRQTLKQGAFPLVLGGDHSLAAGSVTAMQSHYKGIGLVWVDTHGDFNNASSTPSGNIHGTPLSAITGNGPNEILPFIDSKTPFVNPDNVVIVGARSIDEQEKARLKQAGIRVFTIADIDRDGMSAVVAKAVEIASNGTEGIYLSFDLDVIDPSVAPGVSTPVSGGLTYREAHLLCEYVAEKSNLLGLEVVELNPVNDIKNQTGAVAAHIILSLLGKTIM